jgi:hypothetical protein
MLTKVRTNPKTPLFLPALFLYLLTTSYSTPIPQAPPTACPPATHVLYTDNNPANKICIKDQISNCKSYSQHIDTCQYCIPGFLLTNNTGMISCIQEKSDTWIYLVILISILVFGIIYCIKWKKSIKAPNETLSFYRNFKKDRLAKEVESSGSEEVEVNKMNVRPASVLNIQDTWMMPTGML